MYDAVAAGVDDIVDICYNFLSFSFIADAVNKMKY